MEKKIVFATSNPNKVREVREMIAPLGYEVVSLKDLGLHVDAEEIASRRLISSARPIIRYLATIPAFPSMLLMDFLESTPQDSWKAIVMKKSAMPSSIC